MSYKTQPRLAEKGFAGDDPRLLGNRIANMTKMLGIKPCEPCKRRQSFLNELHRKFRGL